ncbi:MAG: SDR family NAD(P)-dependent oxidoreductase, partial [Candidatus Krumholzibacteria bacterium]|nr:SDR family NAD(P)-dependent oxidoreductase [Candidatus Krumholzibacteria bacterium]
IDTVKQAEMFAAIREAYGIPRDDTLKLRDYPTLRHAVQFVYERAPAFAAARSAGAVSMGEGEPANGEAPAEDAGHAVASTSEVPRRVVALRLRPDIGLCKHTGVALGRGARVIVMADRAGVGRALVRRLEKRGVDVLMIDDAPEADVLAARVLEWADAGVTGVYWLSALDDEGPVAGMAGLGEWREAVRVRVKLLYATMRTLFARFDEPGVFLVAATRLGGLHGYGPAGASSPLGGGVCGFAKAFKREKPGALVKVVDFEPGRRSAPLADGLIEETLHDPGAVEIGRHGKDRWTVGLEVRDAPRSDAACSLGPDTVFVVTGAAGSIVSAITGDLARAAGGGAFHLLDLAPAPDPADSDLERFAGDREGLKRDLFERLKAGGERVTPARVARELAAIERRRAALDALVAVRAAGGEATYHRVDLCDAAAVSTVMDEVVARHGRVDVLVHAAGLEVSRLLPEKAPEEFDRVLDVKCDGWFNLVKGLGEAPLGAAVVFSSIAGRFGNAGQTDYSAANDLLCKCASSLRGARPGARGIAIDWTAWRDIGMASRGSIPELMKRAGIDMLAPEAGIPVVRRELEAAFAGEVVVAGALGGMCDELDENGGLDVPALEALAVGRGVMVQRVRGMGVHTGFTVETTLDPSAQPFLHDHRIGETAVLPGVMGIEALVEAAKLLFPRSHLRAIEDVRFHAPFKFYRDESRTVTVRAFFTREGDDVVADCRLEGERTLHGRVGPEVTTHFSARVRLAPAPAPGAQRREVRVPAEAAAHVRADDIYRLYFHGPAYRVVEDSWRAGDAVFGRFARELPPNHAPADAPTLAAPRLIELCFQTAGIMEMAGSARMGLPHRIDAVDFLRPSAGECAAHAAVTQGEGGAFDADVVDETGDVVMRMRGYRTTEMPDPVAPELLDPLRKAMKP